MKYINLSVILIIFLVVGCATKPENITDHFNPTEFVTRPIPKYEGMPHGAVYPVVGLKEFEAFTKSQPKMKEYKTNVQLGWFGARSDVSLTPEAARKITASCGGDKYIAVTATTQQGFYNVVNVLASPSRTRELLSIGVLALPQTLPTPQNKSPRSQIHKPSSNVDLLLNNSTL